MSTKQDETAKEEWEDIAETYKKRLSNLANRVDDTFGVQEKYDKTKQYAMEHPLVAVAVVVSMAMCSLPVLGFMAFVFCSLFCTFMGFLIVEGILLTIGGMILTFVLCVAGLISVILSGFVAGTWLSVTYGYDLVQRGLACCTKQQQPSNEEIPSQEVPKEE